MRAELPKGGSGPLRHAPCRTGELQKGKCEQELIERSVRTLRQSLPDSSRPKLYLQEAGTNLCPFNLPEKDFKRKNLPRLRGPTEK